MSGLVQFLTGGSNSKASSKPVDVQAPQYVALRNPFAGVLGNALEGGVAGFNPVATGSAPYPVAPIGAQERAAMDFANTVTMDPIQAGLIRSTLSGNFLPGQAGSNPFLSAAITAAQRPTMQALQDAVGRSIPGMFAAAGHLAGGSTAKTLAQARATEAGANALGDIATNISYNAYDAERQRQQQAVQLNQQEVNTAIANFQAQGLPRLLSQMGFDQTTATGQQAVANWLQALQLIGAVTAPAIGNVASSTASSQGGLFPAIGKLPIAPR